MIVYSCLLEQSCKIALAFFNKEVGISYARYGEVRLSLPRIIFLLRMEFSRQLDYYNIRDSIFYNWTQLPLTSENNCFLPTVEFIIKAARLLPNA